MGSLPIGRTFIPSEIENATFMNSLSTAVNFLLNPPRSQVFNSAAQSVPNATNTALTFDSEQYDTDTLHNPGVNPSRFTPQTTGLYLVSGQIAWASNATGIRQAALWWNGAQQAVSDVPAGSGTMVVQVQKEIYFNGSSDYVELIGWQSSGGALSTVASLPNTWFSARWLANS